jgi:excisionase family DNA binding protein
MDERRIKKGLPPIWLLGPLLIGITLLMPRHNYVTQQRAADYLGVTPRTIRNWISEGRITGFRVPGLRAIRVDLDEIDELMKVMPAALKPKVPFGPRAKIVTVVEEYKPPGQDQDQNQAVKASDQVEVGAEGREQR